MLEEEDLEDEWDQNIQGVLNQSSPSLRGNMFKNFAGDGEGGLVHVPEDDGGSQALSSNQAKSSVDHVMKKIWQVVGQQVLFW